VMRIARRKAGVALLVLIAALVIVRIMTRNTEDEDDLTPEVAAETAVAVIKPLITRIDVLGTVEPRPGFSAQIGAPEQSPIVAIYVAIGDVVRAGQPLIQLDKSRFVARRVEADAALAAAQRAFERQQQLLASGIAPRKDLEAAAADLARARADLQQADRTESLATLRSPINGVITTLNATLAQPIDVGSPVVEVVDPRGLEIRFHLSPADAGRVTRGTKMILTEQDQQTSVASGTITGVSAAIDSATGAVDVRATISASVRPLKKGETLNGAIELSSAVSHVVVPADALVPEGDGMQVFVVDSAGIAHATPVQVGTRTRSEVQIITGLRGGEVVVTRGAYGITDGSRIKRAKKAA
jgi:RND family efflux transporter MFP subunit